MAKNLIKKTCRDNSQNRGKMPFNFIKANVFNRRNNLN